MKIEYTKTKVKAEKEIKVGDVVDVYDLKFHSHRPGVVVSVGKTWTDTSSHPEDVKYIYTIRFSEDDFNSAKLYAGKKLTGKYKILGESLRAHTIKKLECAGVDASTIATLVQSKTASFYIKVRDYSDKKLISEVEKEVAKQLEKEQKAKAEDRKQTELDEQLLAIEEVEDRFKMPSFENIQARRRRVNIAKKMESESKDESKIALFFQNFKTDSDFNSASMNKKTEDFINEYYEA